MTLSDAAALFELELFVRHPHPRSMVKAVGPCTVARAVNQHSPCKCAKLSRLAPAADRFQPPGSRMQSAYQLKGRPLAANDHFKSRYPVTIKARLESSNPSAADACSQSAMFH